MGLKIYIYIYFYYNYFLNAHNRNCSKAVGPSCEDETSGYYLPTGVGISVCTQKPSYPKIQCLLPDLFLFLCCCAELFKTSTHRIKVYTVNVWWCNCNCEKILKSAQEKNKEILFQVSKFIGFSPFLPLLDISLIARQNPYNLHSPPL